jgi:hypothetical protein
VTSDGKQIVTSDGRQAENDLNDDNSFNGVMPETRWRELMS